MAVRYLSDGELQRLRYELGANVLALGAEPYVQHLRIFDVVRDNLESDATEPTTSATSVTAAGSVALTLASASGIAAGTRVLLDVDEEHEVCTVKNVSGLVVTVNCRRLHTTPFPVEIESGLTIVRALLWHLADLARQLREAAADAGIKRVDEVEFFDAQRYADTSAGRLARQRAEARAELASAVNLQGVMAQLRADGGAPGRVEVY